MKRDHLEVKIIFQKAKQNQTNVLIRTLGFKYVIIIILLSDTSRVYK